jgi:IS30 family transposase
MGTSYNQLGLRERIEIEIKHRAGHSVRAIAVALQRSPATISREVRRNGRPTKQWRRGYDGERAHGLAERRRRWDARHKLERQPVLRALVRDRLAMGWSPEQIAGRLARQQPGMAISHESIYRFIYHRSAQKDYWHKLLPRHKHRRGRMRRGGVSPVDLIKARVPLSQRPLEAMARTVPGHWEADLMLFSRYGQAVLVTHERSSRWLCLERLPNKGAQGVGDRLLAQIHALPPPLRRSMSFDNGSEFAQHYRLNGIGLPTYFCDTHAPWQKGGIENAIGRLRRTLPRKTDLASLSDPALQSLVQRYNSTPRKCLAFRTPDELFSELRKTVALQT